MKIKNSIKLAVGLAIVAAIGFILAPRPISQPKELPTSDIPLPVGYSLENYSVEKNTGVACSRHADCQTPGEYAAMSRCPFVSLCINQQCAVVCPAHK